MAGNIASNALTTGSSSCNPVKRSDGSDNFILYEQFNDKFSRGSVKTLPS
jgi:hypothetical protein